MPEDSRIVNLKKWEQDVHCVWTAVQENEDLVLIRDLNQITDHRNLITALEIFDEIMSKPAPNSDEELV